MYKLLIATIGNQDLQISKESYESLPEKEKMNFVPNNNDSNYYIIYKKNFRNITSQMFNNIEKYKSKFELPILKPFIDKFDDYDELILLATEQENKDYSHTDTIYEAKIIKEMFDNVRILTMKNDPSSFSQNFDFIKNKLYEYREGDYDINVLVSSGLPQVGFSLRVYFLFHEAKIYECDRQGKIKSENDEKYTDVILRNKVKTAIENYNYNFVKEFSDNFGENFKNKFREVYDLYLFRKEYEGMDDFEKFKLQLNDLMSHIELQFKIENYSSFAGEIFSLLQNLEYFIISCETGQKTELDNYFKNFVFKECYLENYSELFDGEIIKDVELNKNEVEFRNNIDSIAKLFEAIQNNNMGNTMIDNFLKLYNKFNNIKDARNSCIVAHGLKGFDIENLGSSSSKRNKKVKELIQYFERIMGFEYCNRFDEINKELKDHLENE